MRGLCVGGDMVILVFSDPAVFATTQNLEDMNMKTNLVKFIAHGFQNGQFLCAVHRFVHVLPQGFGVIVAVHIANIRVRKKKFFQSYF